MNPIRKNRVQQRIDQLFIDVTDPNKVIRDDKYWAPIADSIIGNESEKIQLTFWRQLEREFKQRERIIGHCHKGHIYWRLGLIHLLSGSIFDAIKQFERSKREDLMRDPNHFSSSMGMLALVKFLFTPTRHMGEISPLIKIPSVFTKH